MQTEGITPVGLYTDLCCETLQKVLMSCSLICPDKTAQGAQKGNLTMQLPYSDELEIQYLGRLFDNTSECYKFFWFQAIVTKVTEGKCILTYEELIDEMIADAWYMVTEYHLNLGPRDTLERVVNDIQKLSGMKSSEKKSVLIDYLNNCKDPEINKQKRILTKNVPYRLQAPFIRQLKGKDWNVSEAELAKKINQESGLIYHFDEVHGLQTTICIQTEWYQYIRKNQEIVEGWLQYNMISYLQKRNPSVPGIADKLYPPQERKLEKVKHYWKLLLTLQPMKEIYGHNLLSSDSKDISIDHFVPWSFVAHDELWNLHPTTKSINSSKSNHLPDWDTYFREFAQVEYAAYDMIWKNEKVHTEFEKCAKDHLNSMDVRYHLYREGQNFTEFSAQLEKVIQPVYQSAQNCGFDSWIYHGEQNESDYILL